MRKYFLQAICFLIIFYSFAAFAGALVYRDGDANPECNTTKTYPKVTAPRGAYEDVTRTILTLKCSGQIVSTVTFPSPVCSPKGGCTLPSFTTCGRGGCLSNVQRVNDNVNYDFNYKLPGVVTYFESYALPELLFGSISRKTPSNVFAERSLSSNYIAYSQDGILDKPVILVEGYDPDNVTFPKFYFDRRFSQLVDAGRDLIIVNFPDGSGSMNDNAVLLQNIIQEINSAKSGNYPTAIIGYSMGGIVARKALKNMELAGINHQVSLYVSFDSPQLGANSPKGLEDTVNGIVDKLDGATAGYTSSALKRAQNVYKSAAAREMLIGGPDYRTVTAADFPNNLVRIAITSGSLLGINALQSNSVYEGEYVAGFRFYLYKNWWGELSSSSQWYSSKRSSAYYDNAPGSYDQTFRKAFVELKASADSFETWVEAKDQNIAFIPTVSSLAINTAPTTYLKDIFKYKSPFDKYIAVDYSNSDYCFTFRNQGSQGVNILHNPGAYGTFDNSQILQLICALNDYQQVGITAPDRSFKQY